VLQIKEEMLVFRPLGSNMVRVRVKLGVKARVRVRVREEMLIFRFLGSNMVRIWVRVRVIGS
jgi:hypothetical protein